MDSRLVVVDGNAMLHRAFHALPPLTAPDGTVVNAVYGFMTMLVRIAHDLSPTHLAVAFDRPAPTFRKTLYKEYQIKRPKMDDGLVSQIPLVHNLVEASRVPIYEIDGFEADDVIATTVSWAKKAGIATSIIVTGDRDLLQLVESTIFTYMPTKGLSEAKLYGPQEAQARMGVTPPQIPDFKALAGDQSDGYPGVAGVGPKTAAALLKDFETVENLYHALEANDERVRALSPLLREKLRAGKELAMLSKDLATVRKTVPIEFDLEAMTTWSFSTDDVFSRLEKLGFVSLVKRLQKQSGGVQEKEQVSKKHHKKSASGDQMELL